MRKHIINTLVCTSALCIACFGPVMADEMKSNAPGGGTTSTTTGESASTTKELANARETVQEAAHVVQQLKSEPRTKGMLSEAKAVFVVPDYGRASLGIGGAGGQGVLVTNNEGTWSGPAFYNIGAITAGLQAGVEAGPIAFLVMTDKSLAGFSKEHNFSLNADAGLTIVNYSRRDQFTPGKGADVIVWTGTKGLHGDLAVSVSDIIWDKQANRAYYQRMVDAGDIINGEVKDPMPGSPLKSEFSALEVGSPPGDSTIKDK
jgi:lipid-binding SYLF domain-containing protein